jgi:hypothetical protein
MITGTWRSPRHRAAASVPKWLAIVSRNAGDDDEVCNTPSYIVKAVH